MNRTDANALAAALDRGAADKTKAARSGDAVAADPTNDDLTRRQASAAARILRGQAHDMRADAAAIRNGANPTDLGYTD
ncbi:hypothetical protein ACGF13_02985 [Kitasatospora sp. NPDC048286]|uniref:hypothetical protein n=1 Tax=Kitasatospora sp. NPDC048286 TaxID=3364047 RepID=UPI0037197065